MGSTVDVPKDLICSPPFYMGHWSCGYCNLQEKPHTEDSLQSTSVSLHLYRCSAKLYEALMNKGYRRSGDYLYRNDLLRNCCQLYTIRTSYYQPETSTYFNPTKDQKRCVNKVANFLKVDLKNPKNQFKYEDSIINLHKSDPKKFRTEFELAKFSEKKYQLYKKYQMRVHNEKEDELSEQSFTRFLCTTPFSKPSQSSISELNLWYLNKETNKQFGAVGAFHECYYFNDKLVAISVVDILPNSVSSVYFIWDPDYASLGLGNFSALKDLILTYKLNKQHYYLGYYVPNNKKMNYKKKFGGELLDVVNNKFVNIEYLEKNNIIQPNKFFTLKEVDENVSASDIQVGEQEPAHASDEVYPSSWVIPPGKKLVNIAEQLYGAEGTVTRNIDKMYSVTFKKLRVKLRKKEPGLTVYSVANKKSESTEISGYVDHVSDVKEASEEEDDDEDIYTKPFPKLIVGATPLWRLIEMIEKDKSFSLNQVTMLSPLEGGAFFPVISAIQDDEQKSQIVNLARILGPAVLKSALVISM